MNFGNAIFDLAEKRVEEEREAQIAAASRALQGNGSVFCADCSNEISPERRAAMPSAKRCIRCQQQHEDNK